MLSSSVSTRVRELGIRVALGARPGRLLSSVVRDGLSVAAIAVAAGLAATWALGRSAQSLLFGVSATDPWLLGAAAVAVIAVAIVASVVPARRAASIDPARVLRGQ